MAVSEQISTSLGVARSLVVYYGQPWRRSALRRFYRELVRPGELVFDIGAHVGSRSETLLELGARVVAVEPQPVFADYMERNFAGRLQGFERVAVGSKAGDVMLRISSLHPTVSSISSEFIARASRTDGFRNVTWDREITVPMVTLDALIERYGRPSFCKIDVEGAEAEILAGLNHKIPLIALEYIPAVPSVAADAIERLMALGRYRFNRVIGEQHVFVTGEWKSAEQTLAELSGLSEDAPSGDIYARLLS